MQRLSKYTFFLISAVFVFVKFQQVLSIDPFIRESYAISWDNYGYYLHLPATLIYKDAGITGHWIDTLNNKYQKDRPFYQCWEGVNGRKVNVYPVGLAIINSPFFIAGHLFAKISGHSADGLSPPYQWAMIISALFYAILGMWLLRKLLLQFFDDRVASIVLALIGFGTNLYYYATYNDLLPHIHLFAVDCGILLLTLKWHRQPKRNTALYIGMLIGLATITRPSEIVWIIVPLFWGISGWSSFKTKLKLLSTHFSHVILLVAGMVIVGSLQLFYWKFTSGHWFSYNHGEGFDFFYPFTWKVLFSYKKGWLLYTPMMALAIMGLLLSWKWKKDVFVPFMIFFLVNLWFISSWECWWYAGSFGQRGFVQSYGLMAIPLGYIVRHFHREDARALRWIFSFILVFFLWLNLFQTWQMNNDILSDQWMTKDYYWKIFGKTEVKPEWKDLLEVDRGNALPFDQVRDQYIWSNYSFYESYSKENHENLCDTIGHKGHPSQITDADHPYAGNFTIEYKSVTDKDHLRIKYSAWVYPVGEVRTFVISFAMIGHRGQTYGYSPVSIDPSTLVPNKWQYISGDYLTPVILHPTDLIAYGVYNIGGGTMFVDDTHTEFYVPRSH